MFNKVGFAYTPPSAAITFNASGFATGNGASISFSHTASAGDYLIVDLVLDRNTPPTTITCGGVTMTRTALTGALPWNYLGTNYYGYCARYELANVSAGSKTIAATTTGTPWYVATSVSYKNVTTANTAVTSVITSAKPGVVSNGPITIPANGMCVNTIVAQSPVNGTNVAISSISGGTTRLYKQATYSSALAVIDSATSPATFSGSIADSSGYGVGACLYTVLSP